MPVVRVCLVGQDPEKKSQLVPIKKSKTTPNELIKLAASKLHVKIKNKKNQEAWRLIAVKNGKEIQDIAALEAMEYLVLVRPGEDYPGDTALSMHKNSDDKSSHATVVILEEIWRLIWSFVPMQLEDFRLLKLATVSKQWARLIPLKFLPVRQQADMYGIGQGDTVRYCGLGQWFWLAQDRRGSWVRYSEETRLLLEDAFGKGASVAVMEIREAQDVHQKKVKKPRKQLKRMDFQTMQQQNPSGKGRVVQIMRLPRAGCGVVLDCIPTDTIPRDNFPRASQKEHKLRPSLTKHSKNGRRYTDGEQSTTKKSVTFGTIESKTYETIRGHSKLDAPHPLSLGWTCMEQSPAIPVDQYESTRPSDRRRTIEEMVTQPKERKKMIKKAEQASGCID